MNIGRPGDYWYCNECDRCDKRDVKILLTAGDDEAVYCAPCLKRAYDMAMDAARTPGKPL